MKLLVKRDFEPNGYFEIKGKIILEFICGQLIFFESPTVHDFKKICSVEGSFRNFRQ